MEFEITEERILEVANLYGIEAKKSSNPCIRLDGEYLSTDELFNTLFPESTITEN